MSGTARDARAPKATEQRRPAPAAAYREPQFPSDPLAEIRERQRMLDAGRDRGARPERQRAPDPRQDSLRREEPRREEPRYAEPRRTEPRPPEAYRPPARQAPPALKRPATPKRARLRPRRAARIPAVQSHSRACRRRSRSSR